MRVTQGGTQMYCPNCKLVTVCEGISPSALTGSSGQRWHNTKHKDVNWFRRGRKCNECKQSFLTAEIGESFLDELVELRDALKVLKANAETYIEQSKDATESLQKLTQALEVLQALKLYKKS